MCFTVLLRAVSLRSQFERGDLLMSILSSSAFTQNTCINKGGIGLLLVMAAHRIRIRQLLVVLNHQLTEEISYYLFGVTRIYYRIMSDFTTLDLLKEWILYKQTTKKQQKQQKSLQINTQVFKSHFTFLHWSRRDYICQVSCRRCHQTNNDTCEICTCLSMHYNYTQCYHLHLLVYTRWPSQHCRCVTKKIIVKIKLVFFPQ